jgi:multimeric flavodoxin WrbA
LGIYEVIMMSEDKKVRVFGIVGSPRRGGNTETLVDEVLRGAMEAGGHTEKAVLSEMDVRPCRACDACHSSGRCVIEDDMTLLLERMKDNRVWVLGTPVYWWGPTAQMKAFIDRWYGIDRAFFRGRGVILVVPSSGGSIYARQTVEMLESIIPYLQMEHVRTIQAPGTSGPGSVRSDARMLKAAWTAGHEAVKKLGG